jgi:hypothetical protein
MTHFPPSLVHEKRRKLIKTLGMALSGLMVTTVLVIFGLIFRSESAHDDATCPFAKLSERNLGEVRVIEESRRCVPEAEERRWLVERPGKGPFELARKRLDRARYSEGRFQWTLEEDAQKLLIIKLEVDGALSSEFHEADVAGKAP